MKDFFKWFKSGTKIKRWIFLIIVGIVIECYGIILSLIHITEPTRQDPISFAVFSLK